MDSYWEHFKTNFEDRTKLYDKCLESCVSSTSMHCNAERESMIDLMHEYSCLTSSGEKNKRECLRQIETKLKELPAENVQSAIELDEEAANQICRGLAKTKEARFLERQKRVSEPAFTDPWTGIETINLLRGIAKYGEHNWSEICDKYSFQSFRTPNSLAYKWSKLKALMLQDIQKVHASRGIQISKWDWMQCYIHKLEVKHNLFNPAQPHPGLPASQGPRMAQPPRQLFPARSVQSPVTALHQQRMERNMSVPYTPTADRHNGVQLNPQNAAQSNDMANLQERRPTALDQLCSIYAECASKFKPAIEGGKFNVEEVKKFLLAKESVPVYPKCLKYFELHHCAPRPQTQSATSAARPTGEELAKRPIFKLCSQDSGSAKLQQPVPESKPVLIEETKGTMITKMSEAIAVPGKVNEPAKSAAVVSTTVPSSVPATVSPVSSTVTSVETRKEQTSMSLKKIFLHNRKALQVNVKEEATTSEAKDKQ